MSELCVWQSHGLCHVGLEFLRCYSVSLWPFQQLLCSFGTYVSQGWLRLNFSAVLQPLPGELSAFPMFGLYQGDTSYICRFYWCWVCFVFKILRAKRWSFFSGLHTESPGITSLVSCQNSLPSPLSLQRVMFSLLVPITIIRCIQSILFLSINM